VGRSDDLIPPGVNSLGGILFGLRPSQNAKNSLVDSVSLSLWGGRSRTLCILIFTLSLRKAVFCICVILPCLVTSSHFY